MRTLILVLLLIGPWHINAQQVTFNSDMDEGVRAIAELRFRDLDQILKTERLRSPENRVPDYLEAAALCIRMFFAENEAYFNNKLSRLDFLFDRLEDLPDSEPYKRVFLAELALARSGVYGKFKHNIKAGWGFYQAYNLLEKNLEEHPNFIPTLIPFGVLQTAVGTLPDDYKSVASLFGFEGDIEAGLKMIRKAYYYSLADPKLSFHRDYFGYVYAYANFELKTSEQVSLFTLDMKVKQSTFFSYLEAQMRLQQGDAERALDLMRNRPKGSTYLEVPFFEYYTGKLALMVKPDLAVEHLNTFLETSRDNEHRKSAYRYLAWYHLLKGSEEKAEAFRQRILTEPETLTGSDKQALAEAKRGFNLALIKARLDFDAGRYAKVVENLNDKSFKKHCKEDWERQEFHYRKARALQELGLVDQAILSFMQALNYQEVMSFSLANSTLQLAILFEGKGNIQKSRQYYQAALKLKDYPFHEGVQQKAKAGLGRLP
jgi:hypothetical protein